MRRDRAGGFKIALHALALAAPGAHIQVTTPQHSKHVTKALAAAR